MKTLKISEKTGFFCPDPVFLIFEARNGKIFYEKINSGSNKFNLPKGEYLTDNSVKEIPPIEYAIKLNKPVKKPKKRLKINIVFTSNKHKASINKNTGKIYFEKNLFKLDKTKYIYIFFHELGHLFYNSEKDCDDFSAACLIKIGYNPSQIAKASLKTLNKKNYQRILNTYTKIKQ
jgi:hypothetical protein